MADGNPAAVVYFSATGNTRQLAEEIARQTGADLMGIEAEQPYTSEDPDCSNPDSRASQEHADEESRPEISGDPIDLSEAETIYLGYPVWWGRPPRIIETFLDEQDLSGRIILPFAASEGSGIEASVKVIEEKEPQTSVKEGLQVSGSRAGHSQEAVSDWLKKNE